MVIVVRQNDGWRWQHRRGTIRFDMTETMPIRREQKGHRGAFYIDGEGRRLAALTFSAAPDGRLVILEHTEVDESLRGQGIARRLVEAAVVWAREQQIRLVPVCPFAKAVFDREPSFSDVLA
jgi:predicted GNAT family acetyltransferase